MLNITKYINVKTGFIGAIIMASIVGYINHEFGMWPATIAALKQGTYTFFFGGAVIQFCETLSLKYPDHSWKGILLGALSASVVTIIAVLIVHHMRGTPLPFASTVPTMVLGPPGFLFLAWRKRWVADRNST
ncbi:MAG: hypothetical protein AAF502_13015 [Bacteroidota bacterium]